MNEWGVFGVVVAIVSFLVLIGTPAIKLSASITKLNAVLDRLELSLNDLKLDNQRGHERIWRKLDEHETRIEANEKSIIKMEGHK